MPRIGAKRVDLEKLLKTGKEGICLELEQSGWIWRSCSKPEKWAYVWSWSKAGRFGEVAPRGKVDICLELEQSR